MKQNRVKAAAGAAQSPPRGKRREPAQPRKPGKMHDKPDQNTPDHMPDACNGVLTWRAADAEKLVGLGDVAFTFSIGASMMALPLAVIFVLANIGNVVVCLFTREALHWMIPANDMLVLLTVLTAALGAAFSWLSISSREIIAYQIDLEARTVTLHLASFPKRVDVVAMPLAAIVALTPSMRGQFAAVGYFSFTYAVNGLAPEQWQTRISIAQATLQAHANALRPLLEERLRPLVVDDV